MPVPSLKGTLGNGTYRFVFGNGQVLGMDSNGLGKLSFLDLYFANFRLKYLYSKISTVETTYYTGPNETQAVSLH